MTDLFRTLVVTASDAPLARDIAAAFGPGGTNMWTTPLSADGLDPATHYISSGYIPAEFAMLSSLQIYTQNEDGSWTLVASEPGDPVAVYTFASEGGVSCTQAEVDALFVASDVTEQEPFTAMGRLGLQIISGGTND